MILPEHYPPDTREFFLRNAGARGQARAREKVTAANLAYAAAIPYLRLPCHAPHSEIHREILEANAETAVFEPRKASHYRGLERPIFDLRDDAKGWRALVLHGLGAHMSGHHSNYGLPEEMNEEDVPYVWTELAPRFPKTIAWIRRALPFEKFYRIRLMLLEPGASVFPHGGKLNAFGLPELGPVNVAITNPKGFHFLVENYGEIPFKPGRAFWFAPAFRHSLVNLSGEPRWHLIVEGRRTPTFERMALGAYRWRRFRGGRA